MTIEPNCSNGASGCCFLVKNKIWLVAGWSCMLAMSSTTNDFYLVIISLMKSLKLDIRKVIAFVIFCMFCLSKSLFFAQFSSAKIAFFFLSHLDFFFVYSWILQKGKLQFVVLPFCPLPFCFSPLPFFPFALMSLPLPPP